MAKMLKQLVFGQKKNPPAPPRPDYEGDKFSEVVEEESFSEHDYENISRFRYQVRFGDKQRELLVFENYSEPADLRSEMSTLEAEDLYIAPLDDCGKPTAPPLPQEEDMYCLPYDEQTNGDATYDLVPEDGPTTEYDEPWEWTVGKRLTNSLQVSVEEGETEEEEEGMRRLLYETAFDSSRRGASASSTPTHHQQHRSASPQARPPLNQNFERKISFSPQWSNRSSSQESVSLSKESVSLSKESVSLSKESVSLSQGASHKDQLKAQRTDKVDNKDEHKENSADLSSTGSSRLQSSSLDIQSPDSDLRSSQDYDPPWDLNNRVNGSISVPEKLSTSARFLTTSVTHDQLETSPGVGRRPNLNVSKGRLTLDFGCSALGAVGEKVDPQLTLEKQGWYHGSISRVDAEGKLRVLKEGSYLVRNSESSKQDYSLSLRSARGFMHMKIVPTAEGRFILGQFSNPFASIPEMIQHYSVNKLPIKGAEHMSLLYPVIEQLL